VIQYCAEGTSIDAGTIRVGLASEASESAGQHDGPPSALNAQDQQNTAGGSFKACNSAGASGFIDPTDERNKSDSGDTVLLPWLMTAISFEGKKDT